MAHHGNEHTKGCVNIFLRPPECIKLAQHKLQLLGSSLEREEIGSSLLEIVGRLSDATAAIINLSDDGNHPLVWRTIGPESLLASVRNEPEARAALQAVFETEEVRLLETKSANAQGKRLAGLFLPLRVRDRVIGVLEVYGPKHLAESGAVETFASVANQPRARWRTPVSMRSWRSTGAGCSTWWANS
jgi:hypothetical protein